MASVDAVFGQAPSGIDLSESQAHNITGGISAMLALSIISVSLRIYARLVVKKVGLGLDDWTIIAAQVCEIPRLVRPNHRFSNRLYADPCCGFICSNHFR